MYIEPFTLFIVGELAFVYIIIASFLFYNGRLHNILKDLLVEMRRNRMLRELLKAKKLAGERSSSSKLLSQDLMSAMTRGGPDVYTNLVEVKLERVDEAAIELGITSPLEFNPNDPAQQQILALRKALLTLEHKIESHEGVLDSEKSEELLNEFDDSIIAKMLLARGAGADLAETKKLKATIEHFKNRSLELEPFEEQFYTSQQELKEALEEIEGLKTIGHDDIPIIAEAPKMGDFADEIYSLKCQKFDLMDAINNLKLELEHSNAADQPLEFIEKQEQQIAEQARYMKESDVCISLLETELDTANNLLQQAQKLANSLEEKLKKRVNMPKEPVNTESVDQLSSITKHQQSTIEELRAELEKLKSIDGAQEIVEKQQNHLNQMERNIQESETCIGMLETELETASDKASELLDSLKTSEALNESGDELEIMLQKFVQDSKEMLKNIAELESENERLLQERELQPHPAALQNPDNIEGNTQDDSDNIEAHEVIAGETHVASTPEIDLENESVDTTDSLQDPNDPDIVEQLLNTQESTAEIDQLGEDITGSTQIPGGPDIVEQLLNIQESTYEIDQPGEDISDSPQNKGAPENSESSLNTPDSSGELTESQLENDSGNNINPLDEFDEHFVETEVAIPVLGSEGQLDETDIPTLSDQEDEDNEWVESEPEILVPPADNSVSKEDLKSFFKAAKKQDNENNN